MSIRPYTDADREAVIVLWSEVLPNSAPHNDPATSIDKKLLVGPELFLVAVVDHLVVGTVMGGYDGHRGWVYSVAVNANYRRQGIGRDLIRELETALLERGCLKVNLQVRATNAEAVAFYERLGYRGEDIISMGKPLYSQPAQPCRDAEPQEG